MPTTNALLRQEWTRFRRPGRLIAMAAAALLVLALGLLYANGDHASCDGPCPTGPRGPDGSVVSDQFSFLHRELTRNGSITVRLTSMTGTITYPPPDHDEIVPGLVPWAKAGIIVKDGVRQGSSYAALMLTGGHGVRMQYDYTHDIAGSPGGVSASSPRWLRLTRSGDTVAGYESADGKRWAKVGAAKLSGLPRTVQVGMFATSPGDLTLRRVGLGGATEEVRFTQAGGTFDHVGLEGATSAGGWHGDLVGDMNHTDWEKYHQRSGAVEANGTATVTGTGDIGPLGADGARAAERALTGLTPALLVLLVVAVRFVTAEHRRGATDGAPLTRQVLTAKAAVVGAATFVTGLLSLGAVLPSALAILKSNGVSVVEPSALTEVRVVVGLSAALALMAVLALALGALLRRTWSALLVAVTTIALPYAVTAFPLLPDTLSRRLLRTTPAAAFATRQTLVEYPQVIAHYAPSAGYFPLPWWAGTAVLCAYVGVVGAVALRRASGGSGSSGRAVTSPEAGRVRLR